MSTPVATVADALIAFILSLLRDPAAVEEFSADPQTTMAANGLQGVCRADVQAVKPVVVDHPSVVARPVVVMPQSHSHSAPPPPPPPSKPDSPEEAIREITRIVNQFTTIDNRTTIVDQSVNQNIWTEGGDVTQVFDQAAVVASGDQSVAAGDDATIVDSEVDVTIGDVSIGNTTNEDSFNTSGDLDGTEMAAQPAASTLSLDEGDSAAAAVAGDAVEGAVDTALETPEVVEATVVETTEPVSAPVDDPLAEDLTGAETYEGDAGSAVVDDTYVEEPVEEP